MVEFGRRFRTFHFALAKIFNIADDSMDITDGYLDDREMEGSGVLRRRLSRDTRASYEEGKHDPTTTSKTKPHTTDSTDNDDTSETDSFFFGTTLRTLSDRVSTLLPGKNAVEEENYRKKQGYNRFKHIDYEQYPRGFPRLAAYQSTSDDMLMFRGFKYPFARTLNKLQIEITGIEDQLFNVDKQNESDIANYILDKDGRWPEKERLENELKDKLKEYGKLFRTFSEMQALGKALKRNHKSYYDWIWGNRQLRGPTWNYMYHVDDFIPITGNRESYVRGLVRDHLHQPPLSYLRGRLQGKERRSKTGDKHQRYYSDTRLEIFVTFVLVSVVVSFLLIPALVFFLDPIARIKMAITTVAFILANAWIMSVATGGNVYKVFVGTSTYAALLMIFLGNAGIGCATT